MTRESFLNPVEDSVPKVDDEIAVGEDLDFQRRWWRFEKLVWTVFLIVIVCDLAGLFGRGWLAKAEASTPDRALIVDYERIERANTPSTMTLRFGPAAIRHGQVQFHVSDAVMRDLGAQRIAPQPSTSTPGQGGISYVIPVTAAPAAVQIQLQPAAPGRYTFKIQLADAAPITRRVLVLP